eukprot:1148902-Pelagomonas_calceolata.AAC.1
MMHSTRCEREYRVVAWTGALSRSNAKFGQQNGNVSKDYYNKAQAVRLQLYIRLQRQLSGNTEAVTRPKTKKSSTHTIWT